MLPIAMLAPSLIEIARSELGRTVLAEGRTLFMEVAIPIVQKKVSQIKINFLAPNAEQELSKENKVIQLTEHLDIVNNGLSLPLSFRENQFLQISQKISDDLEVVKGQNEIMFLSNSIKYFLESHQTRTGIDRGISYALQYDIIAVCNYLNKHKELRFPGYLLHQFTSLAETIKDLNIFYASILDDGKIPVFNLNEIKEDCLKGYGIDNRKGIFGMYIPAELKKQIERECKSIIEEQTKVVAKSGFLGTIKNFTSPNDELNAIANEALFILKEELISNEELEYQIVKKLKTLPDKKIIVQSCE